jgi:integration host factor subunit alpha
MRVDRLPAKTLCRERNEGALWLGLRMTECRSEGVMMRRAVTRQDLAASVQATHPFLSRRQSRKLVDAILEEIIIALLDGEDVALHRFGKFVASESKPRLGRNPQTGEKAAVAAKMVLRFRASDTLRAIVEGAQDARPPSSTAARRPVRSAHMPVDHAQGLGRHAQREDAMLAPPAHAPASP